MKVRIAEEIDFDELTDLRFDMICSGPGLGRNKKNS